MVKNQAFTVAITGPDSLFRREIRGSLSEERFEILWEAEGYENTILELEKLAPDLLILSLPDCDVGLISFLEETLSQRFPSTRKLLVAPDPSVSGILPQLLRAGLKGYVVNEDVSSVYNAAIVVLQGGYWLSQCIAEKMFQEAAFTQPVALAPGGFTSREQEIFRLMGRGLSDEEIAQSLGISQRTVRFHLRHILDKLGVATRVKAIIRALFDLRD
ncbi:MAG: response regulator transcription factor [Dehalococcoidia bacterium]|nr:response regulator transcription factor [Dehalococcoidia bacterium]